MFFKFHQPPSRKPEEETNVKKADPVESLIQTKFSPNDISSHLIQNIPLDNYCWRLEGFSWVTEARTFYLISGIGEFIHFQIGYTHTGWVVPAACQVVSRYFDSRCADCPDNGWLTKPPTKSSYATFGRSQPSKHIFECYNHAASKLSLNKSKTDLKLRGAEMSVKDNKIVLKYEGTKLKVEILFDPCCDPIRFGDGNINFGEGGGEGLINMKFLPFGKATGKVELNGKDLEFNGMGFGIHQFQGIRPTLAASRWQLCIFISDVVEGTKSDQISLFMIQMSTPATFGNATVNLSAMCTNDRLIALSNSGKIDTFSPSLDSKTGYYIPQEAQFTWSGVTLEEVKFKAECRITPKILCDRINMLDQLPFVLRKVVETFMTRPFVYQWMNKTSLSLTLNGEDTTLQGWLMYELTILNSDD